MAQGSIIIDCPTPFDTDTEWLAFLDEMRESLKHCEEDDIKKRWQIVKMIERAEGELLKRGVRF